MTEPPLLALYGAAVSRGGRRIVEGATLVLRRGEAVILRGANGAGKSTLLAAIAGLAPLSAGRMERRVAAAALGHANGLRAALSIAEHLRLWRALYRFTDEDARAATSALLLEALLDKRAGVLSAGQARRAAFLRVAVSGAGLLLLDEPTAGMDAQSAAATVRVVEERLRAGAAAIIATHEAFPLAGARPIALGAP